MIYNQLLCFTSGESRLSNNNSPIDVSYESVDGRLTPECPGDFTRAGSLRNSRNRMKLQAINEAKKTISNDENTELFQTLMKSNDADDTDKNNHERQGSFKRRRRRGSSADILVVDRERPQSPRPSSPDMNNLPTRRRNVIEEPRTSTSKIVFEHKINSLGRRSSMTDDIRSCSPLGSGDVTTTRLNRSESGGDIMQNDAVTSHTDHYTFKRTQSERHRTRPRILDNTVQLNNILPPNELSTDPYLLSSPRRRRDVNNNSPPTTTSLIDDCSLKSIIFDSDTKNIQKYIARAERRTSNTTIDDEDVNSVIKQHRRASLVEATILTSSSNDKSKSSDSFREVLEQFDNLGEYISESLTDLNKTETISSNLLQHPYRSSKDSLERNRFEGSSNVEDESTTVHIKTRSTLKRSNSDIIPRMRLSYVSNVKNSTIHEEKTPAKTEKMLEDTTLTLYTHHKDTPTQKLQQRDESQCTKKYENHVTKVKMYSRTDLAGLGVSRDSLPYTFDNYEQRKGLNYQMSAAKFDTGYRSLPRPLTSGVSQLSCVQQNTLDESNIVKSSVDVFGHIKRQPSLFDLERQDKQKQLLEKSSLCEGSVSDYKQAVCRSMGFKPDSPVSIRSSNIPDDDKDVGYDTCSNPSVSIRSSRSSKTCSSTLGEEYNNLEEATEIPHENNFARSCESIIDTGLKACSIDLSESGNTTDTSIGTPIENIVEPRVLPTTNEHTPDITITSEDILTIPCRSLSHGYSDPSAIITGSSTAIHKGIETDTRTSTKSIVSNTLAKLVNKTTNSNKSISGPRSPTVDRKHITSQAAQKVTERLTASRRPRKPTSTVTSLPPTLTTSDSSSSKLNMKKRVVRPMPKTATASLSRNATARLASSPVNRASDTSSVLSTSSDESYTPFSRFDPKRKTTPAQQYSNFKKEAASKRQSGTTTTKNKSTDTNVCKLKSSNDAKNSEKPIAIVKPKRNTALSNSPSFSGNDVYERLSNTKKTVTKPFTSTNSGIINKIFKPLKSSPVDTIQTGRGITDKKTTKHIILGSSKLV